MLLTLAQEEESVLRKNRIGLTRGKIVTSGDIFNGYCKYPSLVFISSNDCLHETNIRLLVVGMRCSIIIIALEVA